MKRPIVWCAAVFVCGVFIKLNFSVFSIVMAILCICFTAFSYKRISYLILIPVLFLGMLPINIYNKTNLIPVGDFPDEPVPATFYISECLEGLSSGGYFRYSVKTLTANNKDYCEKGILYSEDQYSEFDIIDGNVIFYTLLDNEPDPFNYKIRLINDGYCFSSFLTEGNKTDVHSPNIIERITILRKTVIKKIRKISNSKNFGFLSAILTGDKTYLSSFRNQTFQRLGISHLMAVSGFHVSLLLGILMLILKSFGIKRTLKTVICTGFLLFLLPFMGFSPSATRAVIMNLVMLWSATLWRDNDSLSALSFAAIIILVFRPYSLMDASFVLSFTAALGLILLSPLLQEFFVKHTGHPLQSLATVLSVFIFLLPVNIYYFGEISPISLFSNLIFVPIFPVIIGLLLITIVFSEVFGFLPAILNFATETFLDAAEGLSRLPIPFFEITVPDIGIYFLIITFALAFVFKNKMRWLFIVLSVIIALNSGINIYKSEISSEIYLVSSGDLYSVVVSTPEKTVAAIECGEKTEEFDYVSLIANLKKNRIKSIDIFCIINYNKNTETLKSLIEKNYSAEISDSYSSDISGLNIDFSEKRLLISGKNTILDICRDKSGKSAQLTGRIGNPEIKITSNEQKTIPFKNNILVFSLSEDFIISLQKGF